LGKSEISGNISGKIFRKGLLLGFRRRAIGEASLWDREGGIFGVMELEGHVLKMINLIL
jgi:hypothetical protein